MLRISLSKSPKAACSSLFVGGYKLFSGISLVDKPSPMTCISKPWLSTNELSTASVCGWVYARASVAAGPSCGISGASLVVVVVVCGVGWC